MKFPSLQTLAQAIGLTCKRFPLPILFTLLGCIFSSRINHLYDSGDAVQDRSYNIVFSCYLGMLLTLATAVYGERNKMAMARRLVMNVLAVGLVVWYYCSLPDHLTTISTQRFVLFVIALHLLISFVPFIGWAEMNGFWQYNKTIFLRILMVALYSGVLYLGLSLAMRAVENLFRVDIHYKWYLDLWVWIAGLFNTAIFLAGFPAGYKRLEGERDYPKGLKIFTQYVLLPIITIYLLILYAYMFKIIFTKEWPFGWVSYLVLSFAIAGILSLLLIHPIRNEEDNKWILGFSRFFYFAICPLIVLLFLAIERRIGEYGITGERYFVLALTCWLAFIALYFLVSGNKNIKLIPVSLCLLAFLSSFGPWGAFSVSRASQTGRLKQFLNKNNLLVEGKIVQAKGKIPPHDNEEIGLIVRYLVETNGYPSLQPLFSPNLDSVMRADSVSTSTSYGSYEQEKALLAYMGVDNRSGSDSTTDFEFNSDNKNGGVTVTGYDYLIKDYDENSYRSSDLLVDSFSPGNNLLRVTLDPANGKISVHTAVDEPILLDVKALTQLLKGNAYTEDSQVSQDSMIMSAENKDLSVKFIFSSIAGDSTNDKVSINVIKATILLRFKHPTHANSKAK